MNSFNPYDHVYFIIVILHTRFSLFKTCKQFGEILSATDTRRLYQIVDVREPNELATASIEGADIINLPLSTAGEWSDDVKDGTILDKSKPTLCLCKVGMRSMKMANFLVQAGYSDVYNIDGGINEYSQIDPSIPLY